MMFRRPTRAVCSLGLTLGLMLAATILTAQGTAQVGGRGRSEICKRVCEMVEATHISQSPIDDRTSEQLVHSFLKDLDPQKMYFLQTDVTEFSKLSRLLDDQLKAGDDSFARDAFARYLQRLTQAIEFANFWIDQQHDFSINEYMEVDAKGLSYAANLAELKERWRKRIKYDVLLLKLDKTEKGEPKNSDEEIRKRLHKRYNNIRDTMKKTEPEEVLEMYLTALCTTFDPHSSYMSPRTMDDFSIQMKLSLDGIGAALRSEDGYTIVASVVPGGAAAEDGRLKPGDKITGVGNEGAEILDVIDQKLTKVVDQIRGKRGTKVRLQVLTAATNEVKVYELTRKKIELKSSEVKGVIIDTNKRNGLNGTNGRIGVIQIPSFYRDFSGADSGDAEFKSTARDVRAVLKDFKAKGGVDAVIVDLRTNGGGALTEAIEVSGIFIDDGPVVQVKNSRGKAKAYYDDDRGAMCTEPVIVLTNRLSASASEIFAGVIKDYNRGLIVGDTTTHGKGTVQSVMEVGKQLFGLGSTPKQGAVKLTINQFYRVNGDSTQNLGVPSDIVLPSLLDHMDLGEQYLDNALKFDRIEEVPHARLGRVTPEVVLALRERSKARVTGSPDFKKIQDDIAKFIVRKQRKTVSLNEQEQRKERIDEEQKTREKVENPEDDNNGPVFADTAYNNEALAIMLDYIHLLKQAKTARR